MSIQLQIDPIGDLTPDASARVPLPQVRLIPSLDNLPHLRSVSYTVAPSEIPPGLMAQLLVAYHQKKWAEPEPPQALSRNGTIRKQEFVDVNELQSPLQVRLDFKVEYQDSDAAGNPGPVKRTETDHLILDLVPVARITTPEPPPSSSSVQLAVSPVDLRLSGSGSAKTLRIEVRGSNAIPRSRIHDGSAIDGTPLRGRFNKALDGTPRLIESRPDSSLYVYEISIPLEFDDADRDTLERLAPSGQLEVPIRTSCDGLATTAHRIFVDSTGSGAPIRMAIDFGTSYSTVTVYDPRLIDETIIDGSPDAKPRRLPIEQEQWLSQRLNSWLTSKPEEALPGLADPDRRLAELKEGLSTSGRPDLFETIQHLATKAWSNPELLRIVGRKLVELFHDALREPPMRSLNMLAVPLQSGSTELPSDIEIVKPGTSPESPPKVRMGDRARQERRKALKEARTATDGAALQLRAVLARFHPSPKRYFGKSDEIDVGFEDGTTGRIIQTRVVQAAYAYLRELIEEARAKAPAAWSQGELRKAIITYPTIAPPSVRTDLESMLKAIGFSRVVTDYDEAIAAAIFYLMREIGFDPSLGLEAFKVGCRHDNGAWWRNVLVFDIGGGTTDLALVRLTLTEVDPFAGNSRISRGAGGRYYVITPRLLGSTGHLQLGGDLATLRVFQLLKAKVADRALVAVRDGLITSSGALAGREGSLPDQYRPDGSYVDGILYNSVLEAIESPNLNNEESFRSAIDAINLVIPTRWNETDGAGLDPFYQLWGVAEDFKKALGSGNREKAVMYLPDETVLDILRACAYDDVELASGPVSNGTPEAIDLGSLDGDLLIDERPTILGVMLTQEEFQRGVRPVVSQAFAIARGLLSSRLAQETIQPIHDGEVPPEPGLEAPQDESALSAIDGNTPVGLVRNSKDSSKTERVDWLILSGQTCNLRLVDQERRVVLSSSELAPDRVIFDPTYAKRATVTGACYAERLRTLSFAPEGAIPTLQSGKSQFYFNIENLFFYLPCAFEVKYAGGYHRLFHANEELHLIDDSAIGKARSSWRFPQSSLEVYRRDYDNASENFWGSYDIHDEIMPALGLGRGQEAVFLTNYRVRFEVNSRQEFRLLFCQGRPHYAVQSDSGLDLKAVLDPPFEGEWPWTTMPFDLALDVREGTVEERKILVRAGTPFDSTFLDQAGKQRHGIVASKTVPDAPVTGIHQVFIRESSTDPWRFVSEFVRDPLEASYNRRCRLTIDDQGRFDFHTGEVPYVETTVIEEIATKPGHVLRRPLKLDRREDDKYRDPFSGIH